MLVISTALFFARAIFRSTLFAPFQRAPEAERFRSGLDDVGSICDPVQQRLAEPRIRKHCLPLGKRQVRSDDNGRSLGTFRDHLKEKLRADVGQGCVSDLVVRDQFILLPSHHQRPLLLP